MPRVADKFLRLIFRNYGPSVGLCVRTVQRRKYTFQRKNGSPRCELDGTTENGFAIAGCQRGELPFVIGRTMSGIAYLPLHRGFRHEQF